MAKRGPKPFSINPQDIHDLAALGCTKEEIAAILTPPTHAKLLDVNHLEKKFHVHFVRGRFQLHRSLKSELVQRALSGNTAALIFALKVFCKLSDRDANEPEAKHLTIHFDYGQAKAIEERAVPIRDAVKNMLQNYRKDLDNPNQVDPDPDLDSQPAQPERLMIQDQPNPT